MQAAFFLDFNAYVAQQRRHIPFFVTTLFHQPWAGAGSTLQKRGGPRWLRGQA